MLSIKCRKCRNSLAFETWERGELIDLMVITDHLCGGDEEKEPYTLTTIVCPFCGSKQLKLILKRPDGDLDITCPNCNNGWVASQ